MKKLALGALFGLVACGGGNNPPQLIDANGDGGIAACNPVAQTGCAPNEKCTWIIDQVVPNEVGHIGCAPVDGTEVGAGESCLDAGDPGGPPPGASGFDNCVKGAICIARQCQTICDPQAVGVESGCDAQHECGSYSGLFEQGGASVAGACDALCNILDQKLVVDGQEACGSKDPDTGDPSPDHPNRGCFPNAFFKTGSCAPVRRDDSPNNVPGEPLHNNRTDGVAQLTIGGNTFKNGCAPGFTAVYPEAQGSMTFLCTGICSPTVISTAANTTPAGDPATVAKMPRDLAAVANKATCAANQKGGWAIAPQAENCVMLWGQFLETDGTINLELGPEGEQFGFCFPFNHFEFTKTDMSTAKFPNATALAPVTAATTGTFPDTVDDNADFLVSGFRIVTATRAQAMKFYTPSKIPPKKEFRMAFEEKLPALRR